MLRVEQWSDVSLCRAEHACGRTVSAQPVSNEAARDRAHSNMQRIKSCHCTHLRLRSGLHLRPRDRPEDVWLGGPVSTRSRYLGESGICRNCFEFS
jgi:hypothetical protein